MNRKTNVEEQDGYQALLHEYSRLADEHARFWKALKQIADTRVGTVEANYAPLIAQQVLNGRDW